MERLRNAPATRSVRAVPLAVRVQRKRAKPKPPKPRKRQVSTYQRRIENYLKAHPGATRQEARGHKTPKGKTESQVRRERQDAFIEAFAMRQALRDRGGDANKMAAEIAEGLHRDRRNPKRGMRFIRKLAVDVERLNAEYVANKHQAIGFNVEELADLYDLPLPTFFYH